MRTHISYSVTLEILVLEKSLEKLKTGQKLSPIVNALLKGWTEGRIKLEGEDN